MKKHFKGNQNASSATFGKCKIRKKIDKQKLGKSKSDYLSKSF